MTAQRLSGRAAILDAANHHPYARFTTGSLADIAGIATDDGLLWWGDGSLGWLGNILGEPDQLLALARADGVLSRLDRINLPRRPVPAGFTHFEEWDFRWSQAPPPYQPGQPAVRAIDDNAAIDTLLDAAFPGSMLRPGHPMVHGWYGVYSGNTLVACAADRSTMPPDPATEVIGVLGAIAVHPDHRRHGWGAAVTAGLTNVLRDRYPLVGLGVVAENEPAARLYARLGFTGVHEITAVCPNAPSASIMT